AREGFGVPAACRSSCFTIVCIANSFLAGGCGHLRRAARDCPSSLLVSRGAASLIWRVRLCRNVLGRAAGRAAGGGRAPVTEGKEDRQPITRRVRRSSGWRG